MKKISIFLLAAMAMVSCGNSYKAKDVKLNDENDSLNYAVGLINGLQIKQYYLAKDSSEEAITEFIDALENAYLDKDEVLPLPGDQVDLPLAAAEIPLHDAVALPAQIARRLLLPEAAECARVHQCIFLRKLGRWIGEGPYCRSRS